MEADSLYSHPTSYRFVTYKYFFAVRHIRLARESLVYHAQQFQESQRSVLINIHHAINLSISKMAIKRRKLMFCSYYRTNIYTYCPFGANALHASRTHNSETGTHALTLELFLAVKAPSFVHRSPLCNGKKHGQLGANLTVNCILITAFALLHQCLRDQTE